jgi:hypothetical protein
LRLARSSNLIRLELDFAWSSTPLKGNPVFGNAVATGQEMPSPLIGGVRHTDSGLLEVTDLTAIVHVVLLLEGQHCLRLRPAFDSSLLRSAVQIQSHHLPEEELAPNRRLRTLCEEEGPVPRPGPLRSLPSGGDRRRQHSELGKHRHLVEVVLGL